jgi:esterase/lipase superfamily enzyme
MVLVHIAARIMLGEEAVLGRVALVLFALALPATARGQSDTALPEPCRQAVSGKLSSLEKRKESLEREIAVQTAAGAVSDKALRKAKDDLLRLLFEIECHQAKQALKEGPGATRGPRAVRAAAGKVIEVTTYYATNRNRSEKTEPDRRYGSKIAPTLHYGRAVVTIPLTHSRGSLELPTFWRLELEPDPNKHFVLKSVDPLQPDKARNEIAERLQGSKSKALLLFVHGYNVGFREAALRTAQLAHDLEFPGVPAFFSWPSASQLLGYLQDAEAAQLSEGAFEQLLEDLASLPVGEIYIIAHSMGNRIVSQALRSRVDKGRDTKQLRELLLAAPDINADLFASVIAPKLKAMQGTRTTIYASSSDLALRASKIVHGFRRVGETAGGVLTYPGMETIDASSASFTTRAFGHSYIMDTPEVLKDIRAIVERGISAKLRGLDEVGTAPNAYWKFH